MANFLMETNIDILKRLQFSDTGLSLQSANLLNSFRTNLQGKFPGPGVSGRPVHDHTGWRETDKIAVFPNNLLLNYLSRYISLGFLLGDQQQAGNHLGT